MIIKRDGDIIYLDGRELNYFEASEIAIDLLKVLTQEKPAYIEELYRDTNGTEKTRLAWRAFYDLVPRELPWVDWCINNLTEVE